MEDGDEGGVGGVKVGWGRPRGQQWGGGALGVVGAGRQKSLWGDGRGVGPFEPAHGRQVVAISCAWGVSWIQIALHLNLRM